ncbi:MAG: hypothetical protein AAF517_17415 [Planctomycetota bacterium]
MLVVFNMLDEEIVYRTLIDDLRSTLALRSDRAEDFVAVRTPRVSGAHPEDGLRESLVPPILERLRSTAPEEVKRRLVTSSLLRSVEITRSLTSLFNSEIELRDRFLKYSQKHLDGARNEYKGGFSLGLPEETLAIRRVLRDTELWPLLRLSSRVQESSQSLSFVGGTLEKTSEFFRRIFLQLGKKHEGSIEDNESSITEYAKSRNEIDLREVSRLALGLRQDLESFLREYEDTSTVAREVLREFFHPDRSRVFREEVEREFEVEAEKRKQDSENVLDRIEKWRTESPFRRRMLTATSLAFKFAVALGFGYVLPPSGFFDLLNWVEVGFGYLIACYALAIIVSFAIRRKKRFREGRLEGLQSVLERTLRAPIAELFAKTLDEGRLQRMESGAGAIASELGGGETAAPKSEPSSEES